MTMDRAPYEYKLKPQGAQEMFRLTFSEIISNIEISRGKFQSFFVFGQIDDFTELLIAFQSRFFLIFHGETFRFSQLIMLIIFIELLIGINAAVNNLVDNSGDTNVDFPER